MLLIIGCTTGRPPDDLDRVFVEVRPLDYARRLCRLEPIVERHTCMTEVVSHYREAQDRDRPAQDATEGPFVAFIDDVLYRGRYVSNPFAAAFTVSDGATICRGRYSAFAGDTKPIFQVRCSDGRQGRAQIVLDQTGRNGIGRLSMLSGTTGDILFGDAAIPERFR
ncbi:MAG: hypothetical protein GVY22_09365 [Gammaproteobacteria bacterium]|nr:hypothetical protein [Gammaproteobacteria bacterium]